MSKGIKASGPSSKTSAVERFVAVAAGVATIIGLPLSIYTAFILPNKSNGNIEPVPEPTPTAVVLEVPADVHDLNDFADDDERLAYAADLIGHGRYEDAVSFLKSFQDAVESGSEIELAIRFNLGLAYLYREDWNEAVNHLKAVAERTRYPDAYYNLGCAYMGLDQKEKALEAIEKAMDLEQKPEYEAAREVLLSGMKESQETIMG